MEKIDKGISISPSKIPKAIVNSKSRSKSAESSKSGGKRSRSREPTKPTENPNPGPRMNDEMYQMQQKSPQTSPSTSPRYDYNNLPNNIPRSLGLSSAKFKQGIMIQEQEKRSSSPIGQGIASMFNRHPSCIGPEIKKTPDLKIPADRWGKGSLAKSSTGFKSGGYSTVEELDNILAKYKGFPQSDTPSGFAALPTYNVYQSVLQTNHGAGSSQKDKNYKSQSHNSATDNPDQNNTKLGVFGLPLDNNHKSKSKKTDHHHHNRQTQEMNVEQHIFPFRETPEGDLAVHPDQVAFESKAVSVLMANPSKAWAFKAERVGDLRSQEVLMEEIEKMIERGGRFEGFRIHEAEKKDIESLYADKEVMSIKYSDSTVVNEKLMTDIHNRMRSGRHADTHIIIGKKIFPCHSIALEVVSKFFDNLTRPKTSIRRIELPESEVPSSAFPTLMDWVLQNDNGRASLMTKGNVVHLFSCAKYLDVPELKSQCVNYLQDKLETNDRHLMSLWEEVKKRPNTHELMVVIIQKAALSFQHIFREKKFLNLDMDELVMLLNSDEIVIESELDVFETVVQWLLYDWDSRKIYTNEVVNTVRFGLLTPLQLTQISHSPELAKGSTFPREYPELLAYGSVKSMIDDGLAYSIVYESYKSHPEEVKKWVQKTGIKSPRPRVHANPRSFEQTYTGPHDFDPYGEGSLSLNRNPSYIVIPDTFEPDYHNSSQSHNKRSVADVFESSLSDSGNRRRSRSRPSDRSGYSLEAAADALGSPIKQEDIQSLGSPQSPGSGKSRSSSRPGSRESYSTVHSHVSY